MCAKKWWIWLCNGNISTNESNWYIIHKKSKIINLANKRSQQNIICGSNIIQINDTQITYETDMKLMEKLLNHANKITPSYIVFRCKKDNKRKGTHMQFDVSYTNEYH